jgi:hypothetical protein
MDEVTLRAWRPTMADYHAGPEISGSFLADVLREGLSVALHNRAEQQATAARSPRGRAVTTDARMAKGIALHKLISGDQDTVIRTARLRVVVRRGALWEDDLAAATRAGADALLLTSDAVAVAESWGSLWPRELLETWEVIREQATAAGLPVPDGEPVAREDTGQKSLIRAILRRWSPSVPEVSHRWEVVPGLWARIRWDMVSRAPSGVWTATSIKTTETPLVDRAWWRFWRRWYAVSDALYRDGLRNLFGAEPCARQTIVARLVPPYPWRRFDLSTRDAELDIIWEEEILPTLREIADAFARGEAHGAEERKDT